MKPRLFTGLSVFSSLSKQLHQKEIECSEKKGSDWIENSGFTHTKPSQIIGKRFQIYLGSGSSAEKGHRGPTK